MARPQNQSRQRQDEVVERPPWLIPVVVAVGVITFAAIFLWYYVGPSTDELLGLAPEATDQVREVQVTVGDVALSIPANFTRFSAARSGGAKKRVDLHALLPDLDPFTERQRAEFDRSDPMSPVLHIRIAETDSVLAAQPRLELIYLPAVTNHEGEEGPFGLRHYVFRNETGFAGQDMYVGVGPANAPAILLCARDAPLLWCRREILLSETVVLRYRFKRAYLADWKEIDDGVIALVAGFRRNAQADASSGARTSVSAPEELRGEAAE